MLRFGRFSQLGDWIQRHRFILSIGAVAAVLVAVWLWRQHPLVRRERALAAIVRQKLLAYKIAAYNVKHRGTLPLPEGGDFWGPLLKEHWLYAPPRNPLTESTWVVPAGQGSAQDGWTWDKESQKIRLIVPRHEKSFISSRDAGDIEIVDGVGPEAPLPGSTAYRIAHLEAAMEKIQSAFDIRQSRIFPSSLPMSDMPEMSEVKGWDFPVNPFTGSSRVVESGWGYLDAGWTYNARLAYFRGLKAIMPPEFAEEASNVIGAVHVEVAARKAVQRTPEDQKRRAARVPQAMARLSRVQYFVHLFVVRDPIGRTALRVLNDSFLARPVVVANAVGEGDGTYRAPRFIVPPRNPLNGKTKVALCGQATADCGWTVDESGLALLVLPQEEADLFQELPTERFEIVAGAALPPDPPDSDEERLQRLTDQLEDIRWSLHLLRARFRAFPTFAEIEDWTMITGKLNNAGKPDPNGRHYGSINTPPINLLTGKSKLARPDAPTADAGFTYDETSGVLNAVVPASFAPKAAQFLGEKNITPVPDGKD